MADILFDICTSAGCHSDQCDRLKFSLYGCPLINLICFNLTVKCGMIVCTDMKVDPLTSVCVLCVVVCCRHTFSLVCNSWGLVCEANPNTHLWMLMVGIALYSASSPVDLGDITMSTP